MPAGRTRWRRWLRRRARARRRTASLSWIVLLHRRSSGGRILLEPHVLDLVEERPVTDLEHLGGLDAVPTALLEGAADDLTLGLEHGSTRDLLERETLGGGERLGGRRRRRRDRRRHQRARQREVLQHDHPLDEVLELADVAGPPVLHEGVKRLRR